ncbi:hypothetical protein I4U23_013858 [Adineta vaga]|nr:hypothetical protein I4U23_013858 [Adineta vaga]
MTTSIIVNSPSDEELRVTTEQQQFLHPPLSDLPPTFKPLPQSIRRSIEIDRRQHLSHARSTSDFLNINQSSIDTTDDDLYDHYATITTTTTNLNKQRSLIVSQKRRSPTELRLILTPDISRRHFTNHTNELSPSTEDNDSHHSDPSLVYSKSLKQSRTEQLRRHILERRIGRRIHSTFSSSSSTLRSLGRRLPLQTLSPRSNRQQPNYLSRNSKWHFVRTHLSDIAMMNESYARMQTLERDLRWIHLRELIRKQVLEMREMSILRQQYDGTLKKSPKSALELKAIPLNEVVHVERDGRVYSISTRDLVLGRSINDEDVQLDTFAQLDARRKFQTKQSLLKQQEGRTRLKKNIAFSFCLCNLSFIGLMFAAMFIFAMKTIMDMRTRDFF